MLRRIALATSIAVALGSCCFAAWVLAQYLYPFGVGFKPYGDPAQGTSPLALSAVDGRLYAGISIVMVIFLLLNLSDENHFGFLGGLWRGAVASVGGPFAWVLQVAFIPNAGSLGNRAIIVATMFVLGFLVWAMLGVPVFVGLVAGLLSWPARRMRARGVNNDGPDESKPELNNLCR